MTGVVRVSFLVMAVLILVEGMYAQPASATWPLTSVTATAVTNAGEVTGQPEAFSSMVINNYTGPNSSQRVTTTDGSWPGESDQNEARYIQFAVAPNSTYELTVTNIAMNLGAAGGSNMRANIWYSTDPTFATRTKLNASPLVLPNNAMISPAPNYNVSVPVAGGSTFYLRIYPWYTSPSTGKYICPQNAVISGTTAVASATINVSPDSLLGFQHVAGTPSLSQTYSLSGASLTNNVTVTPPAEFELSTDNGTTWTASSVSLPVIGGEIQGQPLTIAVRLNGSTPSTQSGNITHVSSGAPSKNVYLRGTTLATEPTLQSSLAFGSVTGSSIEVTTSGGNGARRIVVARQGFAVSFVPTDGTAPSGVSANFAAATDQGGGNKVVYDGSGSNVTVTNLQSNTLYHFAVFEYNVGTGNSQNYNSASPGRGSQSTLAVPTLTVLPSSLGFGAVIINTISEEKSFEVSGFALTPDAGTISITAPSGYEISLTSGGGFSSSAMVPYSGGVLAGTTVYVRFVPTAVQSYLGSVTNAGGGASTANVAVSGSGSAPPQPNELQAEDGLLSAAYVRTQYLGYSGSGYVDIADKTNASLEILFRRATAASDSVRVIYANGGSNRAYAVTLNGTTVTFPTFTSTGSWATWSSVAAVLPLQAGVNRLVFRSTTNGSNANIDKILISGQPATPVYKLNLTKSGNGSVSVSPWNSDSLYDAGMTVTLTATPAGGDIFYRWGGTNEATANPWTFSMNSHRTQVGIMIPAAGFGAVPYQSAPTGFAAVGAYEYPNGTTGGEGNDKQMVFVTNSADLNEWMLRRVDADRSLNFPPLTIYVIGTLTPGGAVTDMLDVKDTYDVSIIGVGTDAVFNGFGLKIVRAKNIIVRNITFMNSPDDGINIQADDAINTGNHIWIDHCTFTNHYDGALDVTHGAEFVTLSWNRFFKHDKTCLLGHSDGQSSDVQLKVTYHHNYFDSTNQRHPRVRFGKAHVYNNYYRNNAIYGVSSNLEADVVVEGCYFLNVPVPVETSRDGSPPGDLVERFNLFAGTTGPPGTRGTAFDPSTYYPYTLDAAADIPALLTAFAGSGKYDFSYRGGVPLPIQLASFIAVALSSSAVRVQWVTVSEINNYGFEVQKSSQRTGEFVTVSGLIPGHGTSNQRHEYTFVDNNASPGRWFYRLKQIDLDGTQHFFEPVHVEVLTGVEETAPSVFMLSQNYPNPFNPSTMISFSVEMRGRATLDLYNVLGQKVATLFDTVVEPGRLYEVRVDAGQLATGIYLCRLDSNGKSAMRKLILVK